MDTENHNLLEQKPTSRDLHGNHYWVSFTQYLISSFQQKITRHINRQKTEFEETEPDLDMARMLELSVQEFKTTVVNMLRVLMKKVDNMEEQTGNVSREMEIPRKNQEEMLGIKDTKIEMKNAFDGFISRLDTTEERISEHEGILTEISKTKAKRKQT